MKPDHPQPAAVQQRSLGKNLLFSAIVLLVTLLAILLISYFGNRHLDRRWIEQTEAKFKATIPHFFDYLDIRLDFLHPFLKVTVVPNQQFPFCRINAQGHRGEDFVRERTGAFRVAILGGSAAMSWFANKEHETIHECLKAELMRRFPTERFEVYNFAVFTYNSTQEMFVLETEALNYAPDSALIMSGLNDFGWGVEGHWVPHYPIGWFHMRTIIEPRNFQDGWARRPWLLRQSLKWSFLTGLAWENARIRCSPVRFLSRLVKKAPRSQGTFRYGKMEFDLIGARTTLWAQNMEIMARLLESRGIHYSVSIQPCAFYRREPTKTEFDVSTIFMVGQEDQQNARRYLDAVYPAAEKALADRPFKISTLDLTGLFDGVTETVYFDLCHLNAKGTEILARRYADHLQPHIEKWQQARAANDAPTSAPR